MEKTKTYSHVLALPTFEERFEYLKLNGVPCNITFGSRRYLNQVFYNSPEWKRFKRDMIIRDQGCDLAHPGFLVPPGLKIYLHHLNPITNEDILNRAACLMDPENVICTTFRTHQAIHYGNPEQLAILKERRPNDTIPWR